MNPPAFRRFGAANIVSVSWGDHLSFGEGDGRLDTPEKLQRRLPVWRDELGARSLHWRMLRSRVAGTYSAAPGYRHPSDTAAKTLDWDDFALVPAIARDEGLSPWLYVTVWDEGWPLAPDEVRRVSYHNAMHGQHVAWQSDLTRDHPEWLVVDRTGGIRQQGVVSLAYPDARRAFVDRWLRLIEPTAFDGLFLCLRSQSRPADSGDHFGFNEPARRDFLDRYGVDVARESFDIQAWRDMLGSYLTALLSELRVALRRAGKRMAIGCARGDVVGPPLGNTTLPWRDWVRHDLVDRLIIDQNSSQCPSMWHQLWPMHRGKGYVQNYLDATGLPTLVEHVATTYAPILARSHAELFVARQWCERSSDAEACLAETPGVTGLVFGSFRHDNPEAAKRNEWRAGKLRT
jgi:hypothetical protein